jgi:DNA-directed RNA polymerase subunit H
MVFKVSDHILVPEHKKLSKEEKKELLDRYNITTKELPKIMKEDAAIQHISVDVGDVIRIERKSPTAGKTAYYRVVTRA